MDKAFQSRFWAKVDTSGGCWKWMASTDRKGYGHISYRSQLLQAHRVSYIMVYGPIPDGLCVLHKCDNPGCVNPDHLFLGTHKDNSDDKISKGRDRHAIGNQNGSRKYPERLAWGDRNWTRKHPERLRGEKGSSAKLTAVQVRDIRARYRHRTVSYSYLAKEFGVTTGTIAHIIQGRTWKEE